MNQLATIAHERYFPESLRINSPGTIAHYGYAIEHFGEYLTRPAIIDDLTKANLCRFLRWLVATRGVCHRTANERVSRLKTLWRWLAEEGLIARIPPSNINLPVPEKMPEAWREDELRRLYLATDRMAYPSPAWWRGLLAWLWNTGSRAGETLALEWSMIDEASLIAVIPAEFRKGRQKTAYYRLWPDTLAAMQKARSDSPRVFPWGRSVSAYYLWWDRLLLRAGLPTGRNRKTQSMRVSHATWLAIRGGDPTRSLMHSDPATTQRHYLDRRLLVSEPLLFRLDQGGE